MKHVDRKMKPPARSVKNTAMQGARSDVYKKRNEMLTMDLNRVDFINNDSSPYPRWINHLPEYNANYNFPSVEPSLEAPNPIVEETSILKEERIRRDNERLYKEKIENENLSRESARHVLTQYFRRLRRKWHKESEWYLNVTFPSYLPDPLMGSVFLRDPLVVENLSQYKPSVVEVKHKSKLNFNKDLGVDVNQIDEKAYMFQPVPDPLHPNDIAILDMDKVKPKKKKKVVKSKKHADFRTLRSNIDLDLPWIMRTTYITKTSSTASRITEMARTKKLQEEKLKIEAAQEEIIDRLQLASQSFIDAQSKEPIIHHTKPELTVKWEMPFFPDMALLDNTYTDGVLDSDPTNENRRFPGPKDMRQLRADKAFFGNVRRVTKTAGDDYICGSYLVPRKLDAEYSLGSQETFSWIKDFKIAVTNFPMGKDPAGTIVHPVSNTVFMVDEQNMRATYCPIAARVNINHLPAENIVRRGRNIRIKRRNFNASELKAIKEKRKKELRKEEKGGSTRGGGNEKEIRVFSEGTSASSGTSSNSDANSDSDVSPKKSKVR